MVRTKLPEPLNADLMTRVGKTGGGDARGRLSGLPSCTTQTVPLMFGRKESRKCLKSDHVPVFVLTQICKE